MEGTSSESGVVSVTLVEKQGAEKVFERFLCESKLAQITAQQWDS